MYLAFTPRFPSGCDKHYSPVWYIVSDKGKMRVPL